MAGPTIEGTYTATASGVETWDITGVVIPSGLTDGLLIVGNSYEYGNNGNESNVTGVQIDPGGANQADFTKINNASVFGSYGNEASLWYLADANIPPAGTYTIRITTNLPSGYAYTVYAASGCYVLSGAKQTGIPDAQNTQTATTSTGVTTSLTTVAADTILIGSYSQGDNNAPTANSGQTVAWDLASGTSRGTSSYKQLTSAGSASLGYTHASSNRVAHAIASLAASGAATRTLTTSLDAALRKIGVTKSTTLDAALQKQGLSLQTTLDAALQIARQLSATADAALQGSKVKTTTLDSALQAQRQLQATLDAALQKALQLSVTLDAVLQDGSSTTKTLTTTLDAAVKALRGLQVTMDAAVKAIGVLRQTTLDAAIQRVGNLLSVALDAVLQRQQALQVVLDAAIKGTKQKSVVLDSALVRRYALTLSLDAQLVFQRTLAATLDAAVKKLGYTLTLTVDAFIRPPDGVWPKEGSVNSSWTAEGDVSSSWTKEGDVSSSWTKG